MGYILDVPATGHALREALLVKDHGTLIMHSLHDRIQTMQWISWSVHHGQTQYRSGKFGGGADRLLHLNLVVFLIEPWERPTRLREPFCRLHCRRRST